MRVSRFISINRWTERKALLFLFLALMFVLSACGQQGVYSGKLILEGSVELEPDRVEVADIALGEGELVIPDGSVLEGNIYQIGGELIVDGVVQGDISQFNGRLQIGPGARVDGNVLLGGGEAEIDPEARIEGDVVESASQLPSEKTISRFSTENLGWLAGQFAVLVVVGLLFGRYLAKPVKKVADAMTVYLVPSLAMGVLVFVVGLSLLVQMAFTVILIPVSMLGLLVLGIAVLAGWMAAARTIGLLISKVFKRTFRPSLQIASGLVIIFFLSLVFGFSSFVIQLITILVSVLGLGAVSLTRFGYQQFAPKNEDVWRTKWKI